MKQEGGITCACKCYSVVNVQELFNSSCCSAAAQLQLHGGVVTHCTKIIFLLWCLELANLNFNGPYNLNKKETIFDKHLQCATTV